MKKYIIIGGALLLFGAVIFLSGSLFENNVAGYLQIKQAALSGNLTCRLEPGVYGQWFGAIHTYPEATTFYFTADPETGEKRDQSLKTTFNDGAESWVSGSVRVLLPDTDCKVLTRLHRKFKSINNLMRKLVLPGIRLAVFASGPHMSADESYAARRVEFADLVKDQLLHGTIRTDKEQYKTTDPITGDKKTVWRVRKITCPEDNGTTCIDGFKREESAFNEFGVSLTNFVIDDIRYPDVVMEQIEEQRKARMTIITKQAEAKLADARAAKAIADARAQVAETRAIEEVAKTQMIVRAEASKAEAILNAEKVKAVAKLEKEAAEFEKKKQILLGEGEATRKRLVMNADGALEKKLDAIVKIQQAWAEGYSKRNVPTTVFGGSGGSAGHSDTDVQNFMRLMTMDAAKRISVDLNVQKK